MGIEKNWNGSDNNERENMRKLSAALIRPAEKGGAFKWDSDLGERVPSAERRYWM